MKKQIYISAFLFLFSLLAGIFLFSGNNYFWDSQNDSNCGCEKENETGTEKENFFQNYYYPKTFEEVGAERYQYLKENGSFDRLKRISASMNKISSIDWENVGPMVSMPVINLTLVMTIVIADA